MTKCTHSSLVHVNLFICVDGDGFERINGDEHISDICLVRVKENRFGQLIISLEVFISLFLLNTAGWLHKDAVIGFLFLISLSQKRLFLISVSSNPSIKITCMVDMLILSKQSSGQIDIFICRNIF